MTYEEASNKLALYRIGSEVIHNSSQLRYKLADVLILPISARNKLYTTEQAIRELANRRFTVGSECDLALILSIADVYKEIVFEKEFVELFKIEF